MIACPLSDKPESHKTSSGTTLARNRNKQRVYITIYSKTYMKMSGFWLAKRSAILSKCSGKKEIYRQNKRHFELSLWLLCSVKTFNCVIQMKRGSKLFISHVCSRIEASIICLCTVSCRPILLISNSTFSRANWKQKTLAREFSNSSHWTRPSYYSAILIVFEKTHSCLFVPKWHS